MHNSDADFLENPNLILKLPKNPSARLLVHSEYMPSSINLLGSHRSKLFNNVSIRPQNWGKNPPQGKKFWGNVTTFYVAKKKNVVT